VLLPIELNGFERGEIARKLSAQVGKKVQCLFQVAHLVHQIEPREVGHTIGTQTRLVLKPFAEGAMSCWRGLVQAAAGPALRFCAPAAKQSPALEILERWIDLTQLGGPEIMDALVEKSFQVVAAGGFAEQAEQDVFQAHESTI
jgi:hypothetical protein